MSAADRNIVTVNVFERSYKIKCGNEQSAAVYQAATYLDKQMRKVAQSGKSVMYDHAAVVAALNITHELLAIKQLSDQGSDQVNARIKQLTDSIAQTLATEQPVAV